MNTADIRDLYRDFFVARGHLAGEAASLVPAGDASVLFTTAGMQQFKPYFLGVETPPSTRITTCQRSFRTSDIENVGKTARHLTFFEMLGNFSFGDYFKTEAIAWSLELSDELGIDRDKVWVSVFGGDDEVPADEEAVAARICASQRATVSVWAACTVTVSTAEVAGPDTRVLSPAFLKPVPVRQPPKVRCRSGSVDRALSSPRPCWSSVSGQTEVSLR